MQRKPGAPIPQYKQHYTKNTDLEKRIYYILINTKDQLIARREIRKRLTRFDYFQSVYDHLIDEGAICESGSGTPGDPFITRLRSHDYFEAGKKGDPVVVRLDKPDYLK